MLNNESLPQRMVTAEEAEEVQRTFVTRVYGWMAAGLMVTAIMALITIQSPLLLEMIFANKVFFFGLIIVQLGLVVWLSTRVEKMSAVTATLVFFGYAALTGLTLSVVFLAYTLASLASTFFVTAGTFGVMSVYGYVTKRDLTSWGSFLMMGLIGMIIASVVNIFFNNETVYWITTYIGIFIFVGLTAFDTQKIKVLSLTSLESDETAQKGAVMGALRLYLDFINLFLLLLRLLGRRK